MSGLLDAIYTLLQDILEWFLHFISTGSLWFASHWVEFGLVCLFCGFFIDQMIWLVRSIVLRDPATQSFSGKLFRRCTRKIRQWLHPLHGSAEFGLPKSLAPQGNVPTPEDTELSAYDSQARFASGEASETTPDLPGQPPYPAASAPRERNAASTDTARYSRERFSASPPSGVFSDSNLVSAEPNLPLSPLKRQGVGGNGESLPSPVRPQAAGEPGYQKAAASPNRKPSYADAAGDPMRQPAQPERNASPRATAPQKTEKEDVTPYRPNVVETPGGSTLPDVPDWDRLPPEVEEKLRKAGEKGFNDEAPTLLPGQTRPKWKE